MTLPPGLTLLPRIYGGAEFINHDEGETLQAFLSGLIDGLLLPIIIIITRQSLGILIEEALSDFACREEIKSPFIPSIRINKKFFPDYSQKVYNRVIQFELLIQRS